MKCPFVIKKCTKCGELLVANTINFYKQKGGRWNLSPSCRKCNKLRGKLYYNDNKDKYKIYREEHREERKKYLNQYYRENKEELLEKNKQYYEDNKEFYKKYKKEWYEDNKERILEDRKQYYEENKDKILEYQKQYAQDNPDKIFNRTNKRRQLEENQGRGISKEQWYEMMEFFEFRCAYSGEYIGSNSEYRTIDHIIPLFNGGLNEIWNCVPMHLSYNSSKRANDMIVWYKRQEFFDIDRLMKIYEWQEYAFEKWGDING